MTISAIHKKNVEVRLLLNEHATHQYEMKKHLKTFMYDVKKRRRSADIEAKIYTVSKTQWGLSFTKPITEGFQPSQNIIEKRWVYSFFPSFRYNFHLKLYRDIIKVF